MCARRVMGSLDARLADQLKDLPMAKQQRMVDGEHPLHEALRC